MLQHEDLEAAEVAIMRLKDMGLHHGAELVLHTHTRTHTHTNTLAHTRPHARTHTRARPLAPASPSARTYSRALGGMLPVRTQQSRSGPVGLASPPARPSDSAVVCCRALCSPNMAWCTVQRSAAACGSHVATCGDHVATCGDLVATCRGGAAVGATAIACNRLGLASGLVSAGR